MDTAATSAGLNPFDLVQSMPGCTVQPSTENRIKVEPLTMDPSVLESLLQHHDIAAPFIDTIKTWPFFKRMFNSLPCIHLEEHDPVEILKKVFADATTR